MSDVGTPTSAAPADQTSHPEAVSNGGDWRSSLSEDLRAEKSLESFKDINGLAKSYIETKRMVGERQGGITLPKPDAKPEEWAAFYGKLGRPDSPDKYELAVPENLPAGLAWQPDLEKSWRQTAHGLGLTPQQFKAVTDFYNAHRLQELDGATAQLGEERGKAEADLEKRWGPRFGPMFKRNVDLAVRTINKVFDGDPDLIAAAMEAKGNNTAWVRGLAEKIAPMVLEDDFIKGEPTYGKSTDELDREIKDVRAELAKATGARKQELEARRDTLYKARYGTQEVTPQFPGPPR